MVAWAPVLAAAIAAGCTIAVVDQRHEHSAEQRRIARADVVAGALASIDRDAQRAAVALDSALTLTADPPQLVAAIAAAIEPPTLVSTIAVVTDGGVIVAANRESAAIARGLSSLSASVVDAPATTLVAAGSDDGRDHLVFASSARTGQWTILIELTLDRTAFEALPRGTAFAVTPADPRFGTTLVRTDDPLAPAAVRRQLALGGEPVTLTVSGEDGHAEQNEWAAVTLAALCAAVVTMTLQSAYRWRAERRRLDHDEVLLDGALEHQQRVEADLRVSETQLHAVLASTPDTVAVLDPISRRLQLLNRDDLVGYPAKKFEEDGFILSIAGDNDAEFRLWWAALAVGPVDRNPRIEFWAHSAEGQRRRLQLRVAPLRGAGLSLQHRCLGVITDVTEQHEQRDRENKMRDELENVRHLDSLGRLAGGVAHDFRNVLAAVDINTELLAARAQPGEQCYIDVIQRATGRASEMVQQLLSFAKRDLADPVLIDVNQAVRDMEPLLRSSVSAGVSIELELEPGLGSTKAGPGQLDRLILNLVCNARDALPSGGRIRIRTSAERGSIPRGAPERDWLTLVVEDNGSGMPADVVDKVFEPFFTTKGGAGSGLGLASVHGIVTALGGHVAIASSLGAGTSVTIALPFEQPHRQLPATVERPHDGARRIILVDYDGDQRAPTARLLRDRGFVVVEAATASDGLAAMALVEPDVLVTDLVIPGSMNGLDLAARARNDYPGVAVLFVSGYTDAVIADGSPLPHRFVRKPVSADELLEALQPRVRADRRLISRSVRPLGPDIRSVRPLGPAVNGVRAVPASVPGSRLRGVSARRACAARCARDCEQCAR